MNDAFIKDIAVGVTLSIGPLLMRAFSTPQAVRTYLQEYGVWPDGVVEERWQQDFTAPGTYAVHLQCLVPRLLPPDGT
jgi:hypothetical protein